MKPYKSTYPSIRKKKLSFPTSTSSFNKQFKRLLFNRYTFAVGSALMIGIFFGLFTLYLVNKNDSESFTNANHLTNEQVSTTDERTSIVDLSLPTVFVIQLGMFSQIENAHQLKERVEQKKLSVFIWERDANYFLLSGIYIDSDQAKKVSETLTSEGIESFVKQWTILFTPSALTNDELKWLEQFILILQNSLKTINDGDNFTVENWLNILEQNNEDSEALRTFKDNLIGKVSEVDTNSQRQVEELITYALYQLEKQFQE